MAAATGTYWFTLSSLANYLRLDTPLAYLLALPLFALFIAVTTAVRYQGHPPAPREPQIDLLLGVPVLISAVLTLTVLPAMWSTYYWSERPDVISLVLFLSGGIILLYGFAWFWRMRAALVFVALMWPALYLHLMSGVLRSFTDLTNAALTGIAGRLPLGVSGGAHGILTVLPRSGPPLSVTLSTACSGANGMLGIVLVGSAMAVCFDGPRRRKLLWLAAGTLLIVVLNVARMIAILTLAHEGHPEVALGSFHAVIGLVLFATTTVVMLLAAPRFGLSWSLLSAPAAPAPQPSPRPAAPAGRSWRLVRSRIPVLTALSVTAAMALLAERDLPSYAAFVDGTGVSTVRPFSLRDPQPQGWTTTYFTSYDWAQQYFGTNSRFDRYVLRFGKATTSRAWMDVVRTDDQGSLDAYNLQSCFLFHNYMLHTAERIDVGHGVTALLINYSDPESGGQWATVSWAWPVVPDVDTTFERISLTVDLRLDRRPSGPDPEPSSGLRGLVLSFLNSFGGGPTSGSGTDYGGADRALEGVASTLVASQVERPMS